MDLFSQMLTIVFTGMAAVFVAIYVSLSLAYFIREAFTFPDPNLGWNPAAGTETNPRVNVPQIGAFDWAERADL